MKNKSLTKNKYFSLIIFMFMLMVLDAIAENMKGIFIPIFKTSFNISDSVIGIWLLVGSFAYIIFTYFGGLLSKKIGQNKVFILGIFMGVIACLLYSITDNVYILFIDTFILNGALSLCAIAINTIIPTISIGFQAVLMNLTHFFYGLGITVGTSSAGYLLNRNISWKYIYFIIAIMYIVIGICFYFIKIPEISVVKEEKTHSENLFKDKLVYFYVIALGFYIFAEGGTLSWLVNYIQRGYGLTVAGATKYLSIFTALFAIGRLLGGFVAQKLGYINSVMYSTAIALVLFLSGVLLGEKGFVYIAISGGFFAITFPTIVLSISEAFKRDSSYVTGIIVSVASIISMIFNFILSALNEFVGARYAFLIIPLGLFISLCTQILIKNNLKNNI
ncbi:MFS transporter [Hathewaya histolytica]|uniref:MFS transporter n=1 Tax=Hathewaya histolytica TaxID=1498 RepID=UPI003B67E7A9